MHRRSYPRVGSAECVLVIDHCLIARAKIRRELERFPCSVFETDNTSKGLRAVAGCQIHLVIIGDSSGGFDKTLDAVVQLRSLPDPLVIFLFPSNGTEQTAAAAMHAHVDDYFCRSDLDGLSHAVGQYLERAGQTTHEGGLIGDSDSMVEIRAYINKVSKFDCPVLITGETGTGKELVARTIHAMSKRAKHPFVALNCAAIPESLFESELFGTEKGAYTGASGRREGALVHARGGTVLLDEVGEMPASVQSKLLRTIETKQVVRLGSSTEIPLDLRFVAATNRRLEDMVKHGDFRGDLYFRLAVTKVEIPPLRMRPEDVPVLAEHLLRDVNRSAGTQIDGFSAETIARLQEYDWPGNVRELRNLIEALAVERSHGTIDRRDFPPWFACISQAEPSIANQRTAIVAALEECNWNKTKAAARLHWSRMTLYRKLAQYGMLPVSDADCNFSESPHPLTSGNR